MEILSTEEILRKRIEYLEKQVGITSRVEPGDSISSRIASEILGIALGTLFNKVRAGEIECTKLPSGRLRFSRKKIYEYVELMSNKKSGGKA